MQELDRRGSQGVVAVSDRHQDTMAGGVNTIRLASEYEAAFGTTTLEGL